MDGCRAARAGLFVNHAGAGLEVHVDEFESIRNRQTGDLTPRCCLLEQCHHSCSLDALITLGAELGCGFTVEDLQESMELSDEELDDVAGGYAQQARIERPNTLKVNMLNDTENRWQRELNLITAYWGNNN